jgi:hypothetical protein
MVSQSAEPIRQIGVATSTSMFLRQCGGMVGVSIFGAMLLSKMSEEIGKVFPGAKIDIGQMQKMAMTAGESGQSMPEEMRTFAARTISEAMSYIFTGSLVIVVVGFVAILFIPQITLRGRGPGQAPPPSPENQPPLATASEAIATVE